MEYIYFNKYYHSLQFKFQDRYHILIYFIVTWQIISSGSLISVSANKGNKLYCIFYNISILIIIRFQYHCFELHLLSKIFHMKSNCFELHLLSKLYHILLFWELFKKKSDFGVTISVSMSKIGYFWTWHKHFLISDMMSSICLN